MLECPCSFYREVSRVHGRTPGHQSHRRSGVSISAGQGTKSPSGKQFDAGPIGKQRARKPEEKETRRCTHLRVIAKRRQWTGHRAEADIVKALAWSMATVGDGRARSSSN